MRKNYPVLIFAIVVLWIHPGITQNSHIRCYFNHPVNTSLSSGVNAMYNTAFKDTLIGYINRAQHSLDFCVYDYLYSTTDGFSAIANAVNSAYSRGVMVRWIYDGSSTNSGVALLNPGISTLASPTSTAYGICHNKFMIVDANSPNPNDSYVWTGSYNFTQQQNNTDYNNVIIFQDQALAQAYYVQFNQMWGGTAATPNLSASKFGPYKTASAQTSFTVNGTPVQLYFSPKDHASTQMQNAISTANYDLFFGIYTFTDNNIANAIKNRILASVSSKGIEDSFSQSYSPHSTLSPVMGSSFIVYNGTGLYHNKMMMIDALDPSSDPIVCTGSYNWSSSANSSNDENLVIVHDQYIANQYYQSFCQNFTSLGGTACAVPTGIPEYDKSPLNAVVYPNIVERDVNVRLKSASNAFDVELYNSFGQLLFKSTSEGTNAMRIDMSGFSSGYYYMRIRSGSDISVQKLVKGE